MDYTNAVNSNSGKPPSGIDAFGTAGAAPEFEPLPPGIYKTRVVIGECTTTKAGEEAYRIKFAVTEGPQLGKTVQRTWTFGKKALPYTERDLGAFGLTTPTQLLSSFPPDAKECFVRLMVAIQKGADGIERNDIKKIDQIRFVDSPAAGYLPGARENEGGPK